MVLRTDEPAPPPPPSLPGAKYLEDRLALPQVDVALGVPVIATTITYSLQTLPFDATILGFFGTFEVAISAFFAIEYAARWYSNSLRLNWVFKPSSLIDLASFLPLVLTFAFGDDGAKMLELAPSLALLRLLRVLRLQRYVSDRESFLRLQQAFGIEPFDVRPYQIEAARVLSSLFTLVFIATGLIYEAEHVVNPKIPDFFTALYFGLTTLTTVGFGDIYPITFQGRLVVCLSILVGVAVVPVQLVSLAEALSSGLSARADSKATATVGDAVDVDATDADADADADADGDAAAVRARLSELQRLHEDGLVSQANFEERQAEILQDL